MRNRAKCKLCEDIIESSGTEWINCSCAQIGISGGEKYYGTVAVDYTNFLRIDDDGNEIPVTYVEKEPAKQEVEQAAEEEPTYTLTKQDKIKELESFFDHENFDKLPMHAKYGHVTEAAFQSLGLLLISILRDD
jgi:hypothetical protein